MVIYFDFDSSEVRPADRDLVKLHAMRLGNDAVGRVRLEGHADERGSREYNIGLGERRAQAVRQLLMIQGVGAAQIRFTQAKDGTLYAIALGRPESGEVRVRNLHAGSEYFKGDIEKVSLLGHEGELEFSRRDDALVITFPESATEAHAYAFRIE